MKSKLFILALLLFSSATNFSQTISSPSKEFDWQVLDVLNNVSFIYGAESAMSFESGIIHVSPTEVVAPVSYKKDFGLVKVNKDGKVVWNTPVPGYVLGVSKFNNNILVLYSGDWNKSRSEVIGQITAMEVDVNSGKKIKDAVVYTNSESYIEARPLNNPAGEFAYLLVRTSGYNGKRYITSSKLKEQEEKTLKFSAIQLTNDLKVAKETEIKSSASEYAYLGSVLNSNGELFVSSMSDGIIRVEKFSSTLALIGKLDGPIEHDAGEKPVMTLDENNSQSILIAMHFKNHKDFVNQFWKFDFQNQNAAACSPETLTKDYGRTIEAANTKDKTIEVKFIDELRPVGIISLKDRFIVLKEIKYFVMAGNSATRYRNDAVVASFYDNNGKLLKNVAIEKRYETFNQAGRSLGYGMVNGKLWLATAAVTGVMKYSNVLCQIDPGKMEVEKVGTIEKGDLSGSASVEGAATFWFANSFLLNQVTENGTSLQKIEY